MTDIELEIEFIDHYQWVMYQYKLIKVIQLSLISPITTTIFWIVEVLQEKTGRFH